jgi:hypothetical protein
MRTVAGIALLLLIGLAPLPALGSPPQPVPLSAETLKRIEELSAKRDGQDREQLRQLMALCADPNQRGQDLTDAFYRGLSSHSPADLLAVALLDPSGNVRILQRLGQPDWDLTLRLLKLVEYRQVAAPMARMMTDLKAWALPWAPSRDVRPLGIDWRWQAYLAYIAGQEPDAAARIFTEVRRDPAENLRAGDLVRLIDWMAKILSKDPDGFVESTMRLRLPEATRESHGESDMVVGCCFDALNKWKNPAGLAMLIEALEPADADTLHLLTRNTFVPFVYYDDWNQRAAPPPNDAVRLWKQWWQVNRDSLYWHQLGWTAHRGEFVLHPSWAAYPWYQRAVPVWDPPTERFRIEKRLSDKGWAILIVGPALLMVLAVSVLVAVKIHRRKQAASPAPAATPTAPAAPVSEPSAEPAAPPAAPSKRRKIITMAVVVYLLLAIRWYPATGPGGTLCFSEPLRLIFSGITERVWGPGWQIEYQRPIWPALVALPVGWLLYRLFLRIGPPVLAFVWSTLRRAFSRPRRFSQAVIQVSFLLATLNTSYVPMNRAIHHRLPMWALHDLLNYGLFVVTLPVYLLFTLSWWALSLGGCFLNPLLIPSAGEIWPFHASHLFPSYGYHGPLLASLHFVLLALFAALLVGLLLRLSERYPRAATAAGIFVCAELVVVPAIFAVRLILPH